MKLTLTGTKAGLPCPLLHFFFADLPATAGSAVRFGARGRGATLSFLCGRLGTVPRDDPAPPASPIPPPNATTPTTGVSISRVMP